MVSHRESSSQWGVQFGQKLLSERGGRQSRQSGKNNQSGKLFTSQWEFRPVLPGRGQDEMESQLERREGGGGFLYETLMYFNGKNRRKTYISVQKTTGKGGGDEVLWRERIPNVRRATITEEGIFLRKRGQG